MILVTATPHSGKEDAFRSLLTILDENFENLPDDLTGEANRRHRQRLAAHSSNAGALTFATTGRRYPLPRAIGG
jgi:hypothetical protein